MSSGQVLKADKDFTKEVDAALPEAEKLGAVCYLRYGNSNRANGDNLEQSTSWNRQVTHSRKANSSGKQAYYLHFYRKLTFPRPQILRPPRE